ncbi:hypothetical protein A2G94_03740 [Francisella endosymbiont of Ornithodoros moubata]|nr:hypothetical protein A2G94_03740 [Francisella endosymbiont of Ornithodoros moubata]
MLLLLSSTQLTPFISQISYLLAIVFGSWFIVPKALVSFKRFMANMNLFMLIAISWCNNYWSAL